MVFNITAVFYSLLKLKKVVEALNFSQKTLVLHKKNVIHLLENQKVTRVALLRTEARIESLKAEIVKTLNTMAIQRQILANLMGIAQRVHFRIQGKLDRVKTDLNLKIHPTKAFSHRHDYLRLISELNRDKRLLNIAESANYPTLALTGVYGANWGIGHTIRQPGANEIEDHGQIGLSLTYPLFQGGKVMSTIARAKSSIQIIQHKIKGLELQIRLEITRAVLNIKSSLARIKASRRAMDAARESLRLIREKYALGKGTVVEVLDAQNDLLNVQVDYYQALADYNIGLSQFKLSLGGN